MAGTAIKRASRAPRHRSPRALAVRAPPRTWPFARRSVALRSDLGIVRAAPRGPLGARCGGRASAHRFSFTDAPRDVRRPAPSRTRNRAHRAITDHRRAGAQRARRDVPARARSLRRSARESACDARAFERRSDASVRCTRRSGQDRARHHERDARVLARPEDGGIGASAAPIGPSRFHVAHGSQRRGDVAARVRFRSACRSFTRGCRRPLHGARRAWRHAQLARGLRSMSMRPFSHRRALRTSLASPRRRSQSGRAQPDIRATQSTASSIAISGSTATRPSSIRSSVRTGRGAHDRHQAPCRSAMGRTGSAYDPEAAAARPARMPGTSSLAPRGGFGAAASAGVPRPLVVAPFDAELFGHWWHEGPIFVAEVLRLLAGGEAGVRPTALGAYLDQTDDIGRDDAGDGIVVGRRWLRRRVVGRRCRARRAARASTRK